MNTRNDILWRVRLVFLFVVVLAVLVFSQAAYTQFAKGAYYKKIALTRDVDTFDVASIRGNILASDGSLLAVSVPIYELRIDAAADIYNPKNKLHIDYQNKVANTAQGLANIFGNQSAADFMNMLTTARQQKSRYKMLKDKVTFKQLKLARELPLFRMVRTDKDGKLVRLPGKSPLIIIEESRREFPFKNLAARTIGYVNRNGNTPVLVGLEGSFENELAGTQGKVIKRRISGGVWMPADADNIIDPHNGKDLLTTIDVGLQDVAEDALLISLENHNADYGCVVVMEVSTGKIKAIANLGREPGGGYSERYNYAIGASIEPGSTFKLASVMAGVEKGYFKTTDLVDEHNGEMYYGGKRMTDSEPHNNRLKSISHAFETSSNVGISQAVVQAFKDRPEEYYEQLKKFGLHKATDISVLGEGKPYINNPNEANWSRTVSLPFMSIGYAVKFTPLQMLSFYNAVANNGKLMQPYIIESILEYGKVVTQFEPTVLNQSICSQSTIDAVKPLLEGVVLRGTAKRLQNNACRIGGKTGTAKIFENGTYESGKLRALFVGFFPINNPKYSCIVVVENARQAGTHGAEVSAPVFKAIADRIYASNLSLTEFVTPGDGHKTTLQIKAGNRENTEKTLENLHYGYKSPEDAEWIKPTMQNGDLHLTPTATHTQKVPNVLGMGLQDALYLMQSRGIRATVSGKGKVVSQSVPAGTQLNQAQSIALRLN